MFEYLPEAETTEITTFSDIAGIALNIVFGIALVASVVSLVYSGILHATSSGDPKAMSTARAATAHAITGMLLAMGAISIKLIILNLSGGDSTIFTNATPGF